MKYNVVPALLIVGYLVLFYCLILVNSKCSRQRPSPWLVEVYQAQVKSRRSYLDLVSVDDGFGYIYNNLAPEAYCSEKVKVGTTDDGGKWMCSPWNLPRNCVIFALGISGSITFEQDLQAYSEGRCRIISVDSGQQRDEVIHSLDRIGGKVVEAVIAPADNGKKRSMESILKENSVDEVEILKMDIEGAELTVMEDFLSKYTVAQLMIEVHGSPIQTLSFLRMVASKGYLLHNYEINGRYHQLCEYAFIHENRLDQYNAFLLAKYL